MHMMSAMGTFFFPEKKTMIFFHWSLLLGILWYQRLFVHYYVEHQKRQLGCASGKKVSLLPMFCMVNFLNIYFCFDWNKTILVWLLVIVVSQMMDPSAECRDRR